jgi:hypothetical protein
MAKQSSAAPCGGRAGLSWPSRWTANYIVLRRPSRRTVSLHADISYSLIRVGLESWDAAAQYYLIHVYKFGEIEKLANKGYGGAVRKSTIVYILRGLSCRLLIKVWRLGHEGLCAWSQQAACGRAVSQRGVLCYHVGCNMHMSDSTHRKIGLPSCWLPTACNLG